MFSLLTDDDRLEKIHKSIFPEINDRNGIFGQKALWYGIHLNSGELIAFCTVGIIDHGKIFVYNVGVCQNYRRKGYGKQLMDNIIKLYKNYDIYLFVHSENRPAILLYQKCQFKRVNNVYVPPPGHICMKRGT